MVVAASFFASLPFLEAAAAAAAEEEEEEASSLLRRRAVSSREELMMEKTAAAMLEAGVRRFRGLSMAALLAEMWTPLAVALAALATLAGLFWRL